MLKFDGKQVKVRDIKWFEPCLKDLYETRNGKGWSVSRGLSSP